LDWWSCRRLRSTLVGRATHDRTQAGEAQRKRSAAGAAVRALGAGSRAREGGATAFASLKGAVALVARGRNGSNKPRLLRAVSRCCHAIIWLLRGISLGCVSTQRCGCCAGCFLRVRNGCAHGALPAGQTCAAVKPMARFPASSFSRAAKRVRDDLSALSSASSHHPAALA
jgi:hypothetical protein